MHLSIIVFFALICVSLLIPEIVGQCKGRRERCENDDECCSRYCRLAKIGKLVVSSIIIISFYYNL